MDCKVTCRRKQISVFKKRSIADINFLGIPGWTVVQFFKQIEQNKVSRLASAGQRSTRIVPDSGPLAARPAEEDGGTSLQSLQADTNSLQHVTSTRPDLLGGRRVTDSSGIQ